MAIYEKSGMFRVVFVAPNAHPATFFLDSPDQEIEGLLLSKPREERGLLPAPYVVMHGIRSRYRNLPYNFRGLYGPVVIVKEENGTFVPMQVEEIVAVSLAVDNTKDQEKEHIKRIHLEQEEHDEQEMGHNLGRPNLDELLQSIGDSNV